VLNVIEKEAAVNQQDVELSTHHGNPPPLDLVKREVKYNGFKPMRIQSIAMDTILSEIGVSLTPRFHERQVAPYGVLFSRADLSTLEGVRAVPTDHLEPDQVRNLADGRRTFLGYHRNQKPVLVVFDVAVADEIRLLTIASHTGGLVIKRENTGLVRLAQRGELYIVEGRHWFKKPHLFDSVQQVESVLGNPPPGLILRLLSLMQLAYYVLSSSNIGATIVWRLDNDFERTMKGISPVGLDVRNFSLSVEDESANAIIQHMLKYLDGAAIVAPGGIMEYIGAHLRYEDVTASRIAAEGGTRHTSAKRFSFEHSEVIVIVVFTGRPGVRFL
jgi:hypothetical protein